MQRAEFIDQECEWKSGTSLHGRSLMGDRDVAFTEGHYLLLT